MSITESANKIFKEKIIFYLPKITQEKYMQES